MIALYVLGYISAAMGCAYFFGRCGFSENEACGFAVMWPVMLPVVGLKMACAKGREKIGRHP